ncbi:procathepsin L-like [Maniola jurtina]|uniref:procathepsin L-like n=1 Tax=Maniola jurtina TaxID=191418 RepID=UPI001E686BBA|nr:procathepsin L-like [Maniola jurtina]
MFLLITFIPLLTVISSELNINSTTYKIKYILNKYKSFRTRRCVNTENGEYLKINNFAENILRVLEKTERFGEYLKYVNVSDCHVGESDNVCTKQHVFNGLLLHEEVPETHWEEYKTAYNKDYATDRHEKSALSIWRDNLKRVAKHNQLYLAGEQTYSLHLNYFGDWPITAYIRQLLKLIKTIPLFDPAEDRKKTTYRNNLHRKIPKKVDWRAEGYTPKREEQWHCGACYAFAVAHALQAQLYKKHRNWKELSPQQIVDCSFRDGNLGCEGGSLQAALRYAARAGLTTETYYPYIGKKGRCHYNSRTVRARARRWATLPAGDEEAMERAVATIGPLAVAVNASPFTFQLYRSGVYNDPFCVPWKLNHAMLLVGYTPEYWILLNWWGKQWGEDGYMRIQRGFNICGVANMATYVEI